MSQTTRDKLAKVNRTSVAVWAVFFVITCNGENTEPRMVELDVHKVSLAVYALSWPPSSDTEDSADEIRYEIGVADTGSCIVDHPFSTLEGQTEIALHIPRGAEDGPFVGLSMRSVDSDGASRGYTRCRWVLRSPQRVPIAIPSRPPRISESSLVGPSTACRYDGSSGVWCQADGEISHFDGDRWDVFALPTHFSPTDWTPINAERALVRDHRLQLEVSREYDLFADLLSIPNEPFDGLGGFVLTDQYYGFLVFRGFAAYYRQQAIDIAGPPESIGLPQHCQQLLTLGSQGDLSYALCQGFDKNELFLGEQDGQRLRWHDAGPVSGDSIQTVLGSRSDGLATFTGPDGAWVVQWHEGEIETERDVTLSDGTPIRLVAGGDITSPVFIGLLDGNSHVLLGSDLTAIVPETVLDLSSFHLIGTPSGVLAINSEQVLRILPESVEEITTHARNAFGLRGFGARHYIVLSPSPGFVLSSRDGDEYYQHNIVSEGLEGDLEIIDIAVARSGSIYLSGWMVTDEDGGVARIVRVGDERFSLSDNLPASGTTAPFHIGVDRQGILYAGSSDLFWYDPSTEVWQVIDLDRDLERITSVHGSQHGVLVVAEGNDNRHVFHCIFGTCEPFTGVLQEDSPLTTLTVDEQTVCALLDSHSIHCDDGSSNRRAQVVFSPQIASQYGLGPDDDWAIGDVLPRPEGDWYLAVQSEESGFLASLDENDNAHLLADGLTFGQGHLLLFAEGGTVVVLENEGPTRIDLDDNIRFIPGPLYTTPEQRRVSGP